MLRLLHLVTSAKVLLADDAVFFEQHARHFLAAWAAVGTSDFVPALRTAVDTASLQGVLYPFFQSLVYLAAGGVHHHALLLVQAALGTLTVWLTYLTTRRAFGEPAALVAGTIAAVYPPLIVSTGLLLAEAPLTLLQALALYLLIRGLEPGQARSWLPRFLGGVCIGLLMLRPAFQYAGPLLLLAVCVAGALSAFLTPEQSSDYARQANLASPPPGHALEAGTARLRLALPAAMRAAARQAAPYLAGVLLVALPWLAVNGLVFGSFVWSRTGDAWHQVYWGIYPPNHGWWPFDSPVPPKYGVESLPGAWAAGAAIQEHDLDYLSAALDQVRATPLKAFATEINKLYQAYLHPFNVYAENPPLVGQFAVPLHRLLFVLTLAGVCLAWLRPVYGLVLVAGLVASALPFLASHIDLRYTVPSAQVAAVFAGGASTHLASLWPKDAWRDGKRRGRRALASLQTLVVALLPFAAWSLGVPQLVAMVHQVAPWHAHLAQTALMCLALVAAGLIAGRALAARRRSQDEAETPNRSARSGRSAAAGLVISGIAFGGTLALVYGVQALYDGDWHQWTAPLQPGDAVRQTLVLPAGWQPPAGSRAELRLYLAGSRGQRYEPVVRAGGRELQRLGPGFRDAGPLTFDAPIMVGANNQGKERAEVPQWYSLPLDTELLAAGRVEIELAIERPATSSSAAAGRAGRAGVIIWGDYSPRPGSRVYEGPAVYSRIHGADEAFHKFTATGEYGLWRWTPLLSVRAEPARQRGARWHDDDLSGAPGRQTGEYRIRLLVFDSGGELVALF